MQNRTIEIKCRLSRMEADAFNKRVKKSGLSRECYLRQLMIDSVPTDAPPPEYFAMMRELHYIGVNLNQIAQKAHILNVVDANQYDEYVDMLNRAVVDIINAVMLPRKIERQ